jgi:hypothetical protein
MRAIRALVCGFGLLLLTVGASAQQSVVIPGTTASIPITGTIGAATVIVTGVAGKSVYVTAVGLIPVATSAVTFTQNTGAACGTGTKTSREL